MTKRLPRTMPGKDLTGDRFGLLVALHPTAKICQAKCRIWVCECKCGNLVEVSTRDLRGNSLHCGCGHVTSRPKPTRPEVVELNNRWLARPLIGGDQ